ncbi:hypothetical protein BFW01_g8170 [Lasiodiplodia theobromae]|uniref:uncharacterized protein n=1 Tax=Lasiodiplodia theobromae TaxID=45133 RepID=UPI0015C2EBF3|nr:uncharacterized protein LTHEOB_1391 [Lasiodiplodia theobromae]KAF4539037.1 hypothetical protein LTHEOB_1391 [Lasiodiplodia theobromae]KAF9637274.1 hypothetical protein BFW01_g8170 [Lasiodiplodia theobromae]
MANMSALAPDIVRDGFAYQGQLLADVGNFNRHPRASEAELTALLRPDKSSKTTSQKDQVGHWYVAQLKHYGLPQTKDKNAAKIRLLDALNTGKLKVPADVKKLETALKKEYNAAIRKARAEAKAKTPVADAAPTTPAKKRKRDEKDDSGRDATAASARKTKEAEPAKKKTQATPVAPAKKKAQATPAKPAKTKTQATPAKPRTAATPQKKKTAASDPKKPTSDSKKGVYFLTIPNIANEWRALAATPKSFKILLCPDGDRLWGSYTFGPFSGVFLIDEGPRDETFRFVWRGTDTSDPTKVKFATGLGDMHFLDARQIAGTFYNLYDYRTSFEGKVASGARHCPRDALSFQNEWDDYATTNNWFGRPSIKVPQGERRPIGQFAKNPALSALKPDEPRYLPVDTPEDTPPKGQQEQKIKEEPDSPSGDSQPIPADTTARRTSYVQPTDGFYSNSLSVTRPGHEPVDIGQITGIYDIRCLQLEDDFLETQNNLMLRLNRDPRSSKCWASFDWGPFSGVIQMNPGPASYSPHPVTLGWRARDLLTDRIRFGRGCNGKMVFPKPGAIEGTLFGLYGEAIEFWGERRTGPRNCGRAPNSFQEDWDSYPSQVYGPPSQSGSDDGELYDQNGNLNPRGRFSELLKRNQSG